MLVNLAGNVVNIGLCYGLVSGVPPFPALGIRGAALALVAGNAVTTVSLVALFLSRTNREAFGTWRLRRLDRPLFGRLMRFGLPNGVGLFLDIAAFTAFIFLIGDVGKTALAANNLVLSLETVSFMPILAISIATSTLVGQMIGEGRPEVGVRCAGSALKLNLLYTGSLAVLFTVLPDVFIRLFAPRTALDFAAIADQARSLLRILAVFILVDAVNITYAGAIKGAGDTRFQMTVSVILAWLFFVPGVWVICNVLRWRIEWAWVWSTIYLTLLAVAFWLRFRSNRWRDIDLVGQAPGR
jgi:MATE family multidrug resistance protein